MNITGKAKAWLKRAFAFAVMGGIWFLLRFAMAEVPSQIEEGESLGILSETAVSRQEGLYTIISMVYPYIAFVLLSLVLISFFMFLHEVTKIDGENCETDCTELSEITTSDDDEDSEEDEDEDEDSEEDEEADFDEAWRSGRLKFKVSEAKRESGKYLSKLDNKKLDDEVEQAKIRAQEAFLAIADAKKEAERVERLEKQAEELKAEREKQIKEALKEQGDTKVVFKYICPSCGQEFHCTEDYEGFIPKCPNCFSMLMEKERYRI